MSKSPIAYIAPFGLFMLLLAARPLVEWLAGDSFLAAAPEQIIYPAQTLLCGGLLVYFWPRYELKDVVNFALTLLIAFVVFMIWIAPQFFLHTPPREVGFDPTIFKNHTVFLTVIFVRFLRLVLVVPLLEEIFWRGFLLRDLISRDFTSVRIGAFSWFSFAAVTLLFGLAHWGAETWTPGPDFIPALFAGALFNLVAYQTRSLSSCVLAHAATNLLLGVYILRTGQWGFW